MVSSSPRIKNLGTILNDCSVRIWEKYFLKKDNGPGLGKAKQGLMKMVQEFRQAVYTHPPSCRKHFSTKVSNI